MSAVAEYLRAPLPAGAPTIIPAIELDVAEQERGELEVAAAYGRPAPLSILRRLAKGPDGTWLLSYRTCRLTDHDFHAGQVSNLAAYRQGDFDRARHNWPGLQRFADALETRYAPIAEVLAIIAQPDGPEAMAAQFDHLMIGYKAWEQVQLQDAQAAADAQRERTIVEEQKRVAYRFAEWAGLFPLAQALYTVAVAVDGGKTLTMALRDVAATANSPNPRFPWPAKKWW